MRAVVCQRNQLTVEDVPEPEPQRGQVLVEVVRAGICGSDLHLREHTDHMKDLLDRTGDGANFPSAEEPLVMGHEFCARVLDYGPGCRKAVAPGTLVVAPPLLKGADALEAIGLSKNARGAYAERMVLQEFALMPVTNGLRPEVAALTEPMAVGLHAVNRAKVKRGDVAVVIGCGPVGLAVISVLASRGVKTIVASDFSPTRRRFAKTFGAHVLVDPKEGSPFDELDGHGFHPNITSLANFGIDALEKVSKLPVPWWHVWRLGELLGMEPKAPVIFDCVGVPGMHRHIIEGAPVSSRIIVVGVCMGTDHYEPSMAINKELNVQYVLAYTPLEYRDTLHLIAEGKLVAEPMITGEVGLSGVANAFEALGDPEKHAKILVDPKSVVDAA